MLDIVNIGTDSSKKIQENSEQLEQRCINLICVFDLTLLNYPFNIVLLDNLRSL